MHRYLTKFHHQQLQLLRTDGAGAVVIDASKDLQHVIQLSGVQPLCGPGLPQVVGRDQAEAFTKVVHGYILGWEIAQPFLEILEGDFLLR
jgi:hypothetical protein